MFVSAFRRVYITWILLSRALQLRHQTHKSMAVIPKPVPKQRLCLCRRENSTQNPPKQFNIEWCEITLIKTLPQRH